MSYSDGCFLNPISSKIKNKPIIKKSGHHFGDMLNLKTTFDAYSRVVSSETA